MLVSLTNELNHTTPRLRLSMYSLSSDGASHKLRRGNTRNRGGPSSLLLRLTDKTVEQVDPLETLRSSLQLACNVANVTANRSSVDQQVADTLEIVPAECLIQWVTADSDRPRMFECIIPPERVTSTKAAALWQRFVDLPILEPLRNFVSCVHSRTL